MVSTRHHPRSFPPPEIATSPTSTRRSPQTPTSATASSKADADSPAPTTTAKRSRATSRKRNSIAKEERPESPTKSLEIEKTTITSPTTRSHQRSQSRPSSAVARSKTTSSKEKHVFTHTPPPFLIPWMIISLPLVIWDTAYVLGRPHTMPNGRFHSPIWIPYALYGSVDHTYGWPAFEARNGFTAAQAYLNLVETAIYIYYLVVLGRCYLGHDGFFRGVAVRGVTDLFTRHNKHGAAKVVFRGGRDLALAVLLCFTCFVMTTSKTVLYGLNEACSGFAGVRHNSLNRLIGLYIFPNGSWIVIPTYLAWVMGKDIVDGLVGKKTSDGHKVE